MSLKSLGDMLTVLIKPALRGADGAGARAKKIFSHLEDHMAKHADEFQDPKRFDEAIETWQKKLSDDLGETLDGGILKLVKSGTFKSLMKPERLKALTDFDQNFSNIINGAAEFDADSFGKNWDDLVEELKFSDEAAGQFLGSLKGDYLKSVEGRNRVIEGIAESKFAHLGGDEQALFAARLEWEELVKARAKELQEPSLRASVDKAFGNIDKAIDDVMKPADDVVEPAGKLDDELGDISSWGQRPPIEADDLRGGAEVPPTRSAGASHTVENAPLPGETPSPSRTQRVMNAVRHPKTFLSKIELDGRTNKELQSIREANWYQYTVGMRMNYLGTILRPWGLVKGEGEQKLKLFPSASSALRDYPNWLSAGRRFIRKKIKFFDKILKETDAGEQFAALESNKKRALHALENGGPLDIVVNGKTIPLAKEGEVTKDSIGRLLGEICREHAADAKFRVALEDFSERLQVLKDHIDKIDSLDKYSYRKGLTHNMKSDMQLWVRRMERITDSYKEVNPMNNDFFTEMVEEIKNIKNTTSKSSHVDKTIADTLKVMIECDLGEMGSQHFMRKTGRHLKENLAEGGYVLRNSENAKDNAKKHMFDLGEWEKDYLTKYGLEKSLEQGAFIDATEKAVSEDIGNRNAGILIKFANEYKSYLAPDGTLTSPDTAAQNTAKALTNEFAKYGRTGRILAHQVMEYQILKRGAKDLETLPKVVSDRLDEIALKASQDKRHFDAEVAEKMARKSRLAADGGNADEARATWDKLASGWQGMRLSDEAERRIFPVHWKERSFLGNIGNVLARSRRLGGMAGPAAQDMTWMALQSGWRRLKWLSGRKIIYDVDNPEKMAKATKYVEPTAYTSTRGVGEAKGLIKKTAAITDGYLIRPLITNPISILHPKTTIMHFPFEVTMGSAYSCGSLAATVGAGWSGIKYWWADSEAREDPGVYIPKLAGQFGKTTITPGLWVVGAYTHVHDFLVDDTAGFFLKANAKDKHDDLKSFWREEFQIESDGGLPYREGYSRVLGILDDAATGWLVDKHLNDDGRRKLRREREEKEKAELNEWLESKKGFFKSKNGEPQSSEGGMSSFFNSLSPKDAADDMRSFFKSKNTTPSSDPESSGGTQKPDDAESSGDEWKKEMNKHFKSTKGNADKLVTNAFVTRSEGTSIPAGNSDGIGSRRLYTSEELKDLITPG